MAELENLNTTFTADTKDLEKGIQTVKKSLSDTENKLENAFGGIDKSLSSAGGQVTDFGKDLEDALSDSVSLVNDVTSVVENLAKELGLVSDVKVDTGGLDNLGSVAKDVSKDVEKLEDSLGNLGKGVGNGSGISGIVDDSVDAETKVSNLYDELKGLGNINLKFDTFKGLADDIADAGVDIDKLGDTLKGLENSTINWSMLKRLAKEAKEAEGDVESLNTTIKGLGQSGTGGAGSGIDKLGNKAKGAESEVDGLGNALKGLDGGSGADEVADDLGEIADRADDATFSLESMASTLGGLAGIGGLSGAYDAALEQSEIKYQLESAISSGRGGTREVTDEALKGIQAEFADLSSSLGVEGALDLVTNISTKSHATNVADLRAEISDLGGSAEAIAYKYDVDASEIYTEARKISAVLDINESGAMAFQNRLLELGFPPGHIDELSEYSTTLKEAGMATHQIQSIYLGIADSDTWNVDKMADGFKESGIVMKGYAGGLETLSKEQIALFDNSGIGASQMVKWSREMVKGGDGAKDAWYDLFGTIRGIEDPMKRSALMAELMGTMYEDNGNTMIPIMGYMTNEIYDQEEAQEKLNKTTKEFSEQPFERIAEALQNIKMSVGDSLEPIIEPIADVLEVIASNPKAIGMITKLAVGLMTLTAIRGAQGFLSWLTKPIEGLSSVFGGLTKSTKGGSGGSGGGNMFAPFLDTLNGFLKGASGLAIAWGAIQLIGELADALKEVNDKVPSNILDLAPKIISMGLAFGAMALTVDMFGKYAKTNWASVGIGLAGVALISADIMLLAQAMQDINNKVSGDLGDLGKKLASMAIAVGAMTLLVSAVGLYVTSGVGTALVLAGLAGIALIALEMILVAEAIQAVNDKVPDNVSGVLTKIDSIAEIVRYMANSDLGTLSDAINSLVGAFNVEAVVLIIEGIVKVGNKLNDLGSIEIPENAKSQITKIQDVMGSITKSTFSDLIGSLLTTADIDVISLAIQGMIELSSKLTELSALEVNVEGAKTNIKGIYDVIGSLGKSSFMDIINNLVDTGTMGTAILTLKTMAGLIDDISVLSNAEIDIPRAKATVNGIKDIVGSLGTSVFGDMFSNLIEAGTLLTVKATINEMINLGNRLMVLGSMPLDVEAVRAKLANLKEAVNELNGFPEVVGVEGLVGLVTSVMALSTQLQLLTATTMIGAGVITSGLLAVTTGVLTMTSTTTVSMSTMIGMMSTTMTSLNSIVVVGMSNVVSTMRAQNTAIVATFNGLGGRLYQAGVFSMTGFANGIHAGSGSAISAALSVANSVSRTIQSALDIHSPSRVMLAFGKFVSEGLANGILAGKSMVENASNSLAGIVLPDYTGLASGLQTDLGINLDTSQMDGLRSYRDDLQGTLYDNVNANVNYSSRDNIMDNRDTTINIYTEFGDETFSVVVDRLSREQDKAQWKLGR